MTAPLALLLAAASPAPQPESPAAQRVRADVEFLASDLLEGRDTGSRGYDIAAAYVASQFRAIGLKPGARGGSWYQPVPFRRASHADPPRASLALAGETAVLQDQVDFAVNPSLMQQVRTVDAPLVFAGRGISDARAGIDDYAGLDVRGKIVVVLRGTPPGLPSEIAAHLRSSKRATAAGKGAVGVLEIAGTGSRRGGDRLASYALPVIDWVEPNGAAANEGSRLALAGAISQELAERLFKAAGQDFSKALSGLARPAAISGFALPARLKLSDRMHWANFTSPNVIGLLPGSDPALAQEHVVLMGHLDHLGLKTDATAGEDSIYNGAIDNSGGIATMLEAARAFVASGRPPRRSILFIANTGEERGLRGADYFAANPTVPLQGIVAVVNLDMPMLLYEFTDVVAFGAERSTIARGVVAAAESLDIAVSPDPMPEQALFTRSDHYPLVKRGVPSIFLMTGHANGGKKAWNDFFATTYHRPNDDLRQPILWEQGARYAELNYRLARALADADQRPLWYQGDYFGDTFAPSQPKAKK